MRLSDVSHGETSFFFGGEGFQLVYQLFKKLQGFIDGSGAAHVHAGDLQQADGVGRATEERKRL